MGAWRVEFLAVFVCGPLRGPWPFRTWTGVEGFVEKGVAPAVLVVGSLLWILPFFFGVVVVVFQIFLNSSKNWFFHFLNVWVLRPTYRRSSASNVWTSRFKSAASGSNWFWRIKRR